MGRAFSMDGQPVSGRRPQRPVLVPLPHPSGASRWLNHPGNRALLDRALRRLRALLYPVLGEAQVRRSSAKLR